MPTRSPATAANGTGTAIAFLAAGTTFFTLLSWDDLSDDSSAYLVPLFWVCLGVAALGLFLRSLRVPAPVVFLGQVVAVGLLVHRHWDVGGALGGWIPTPSSLEEVGELMRGAVDATIRYAAPIPASAVEFAPLMLASGAAVVLVVDLLACTLRRVPLAGLPLLATFTAPVSLLGGVSWVTFALAAVCFVLLLAADQASRLGQWGRSLSGPVTDDQPHSVGLSTVWPTATRIGFAGIGLAVLAPSLLPATSGLLGRDDDTGTGDADDEINSSNPMLNVQRDLLRGDDFPVLSVQTDDPDPRYLRLSALDEFTGALWLPSDRDIPIVNRVATAEIPSAPGLDEETGRTAYTWSISVEDAFESDWLPLPYPVTDVEVDGDWRYDERTLDVMTPVNELTTAGLEYEAAGQEVDVDPEALVAAPPPNRTVFIDGTKLPASVPPWLEDRAREVTEGAKSSFESAVMLQQWFRVDGGFEYSIERSDDGNSTDQLALFLGSGEGSRVGYCEQFAAAMALLARTLNIPARVAVGFLEPERVGDSWVYSSHDLHAWPELYFEGAGWLRFEPTPSDENVAAPDYTTGQIPQPDDVETPTASPPLEETSAPPTPDRAPESANGEDESGFALLRWVGWSALVLAGLALLALPRVVRTLLRRRRLSGEHPAGTAEAAWAEVRATALDLGLGWDDAVTLRRRARSLVPALAPAAHGTDEPVREIASPLEALERLVPLVERHRFSRNGLPEEAQSEIPALAVTVTEAMHRGAKSSAQRRATWLPASLWRAQQGVRRRYTQSVDRMGELDRVSL